MTIIIFAIIIRLRVAVHKIVTYPLFDTVIMVIIALRYIMPFYQRKNLLWRFFLKFIPRRLCFGAGTKLFISRERERGRESENSKELQNTPWGFCLFMKYQLCVFFLKFDHSAHSPSLLKIRWRRKVRGAITHPSHCHRIIFVVCHTINVIES